MDKDHPDKEPLRDPNRSNVVEYRSTPSREVADRLDTDLAAESVGGMTGTLGGAAIGSLAGPIGAVIGAIAGAIGGWWVGREAAEHAAGIGEADEQAYREHFESAGHRADTERYENARAAYMLGDLAGHNPEYRGKSFDEIAPILERGWLDVRTTDLGSWAAVQEYARYGYLRARGK